ncbi:FxsA family protein [Sinimarinibacterium sp. CAU 1509]|uniref:FxsA family protein n=1 Tax=Sinimarinibacterium sp. CAU 1509 TaxID=2562283 RepID=UPI0010AC1EE0|nr:FxsA family protein [Sinimarinibacterium sp. CAU 1509]TJY61898.1 FxsA family protein [Sinimarinibacterium sp. CAU 1509]
MRAVVLILWLVAEVWLLQAAADRVGVVATALWLLIAVGIGSAVIRLQGLRTMLRAQEAVARGERPSLELIDGSLGVVAGMLLVFPGLASDCLALPLLIPPLRHMLTRYAERTLRRRYPDLREGVVIQGEYREASRPQLPYD